MRQRRWLLVLPGLMVLVIAFVVPSLIMLLAPPGAGPVDVWARFVQMSTDGFELSVLWRTLAIGLVVTVVCIALGFPTAYLLARSNSRYAGLFLALAIFPLLLNNVVRTFGWLVILGREGALGQALLGIGLVDEAPQLLYTPLAIILGLTQLFLPLAIVACYSAVAQVDPALDSAARGLGANRSRTFWSVVVPLSLPGIVVAATLVFAGSVTAYTTPYLLGGSRQRMLSTQLFTYAGVSVDWVAASATAFTMTILLMVVTAVTGFATSRKGSLT